MSQQSSVENALKRSRDLIRQQKYGEAAEVLQKLLESDPKEEDALELLGMARFFGQDLEAARETFEQLIQLNPTHTKACVNLGAVLNRLGEYKKAVEVLRRTLQRDRKCAEGYYNMGIAQRGLNLNTMAISAYKEAIKLKPTLIEAHLNLGNIYAEMKNMGLALQCYQTALRHDPNSKKAKSSLEKAMKNQKSARKVASPFGRLVDVNELERQQRATGPRNLDNPSRVAERELVQKVTKTVRSCGKDLVPLLDDSLQGQLHRLQIIVFQSENRLSSAEHMDTFSQTLEELQTLKTTIANELNEIREHLPAEE